MGRSGFVDISWSQEQGLENGFLEGCLTLWERFNNLGEGKYAEDGVIPSR